MEMTICVIFGSSLPARRSVKISSNFGMTVRSRKTVMPMAAQRMTDG